MGLDKLWLSLFTFHPKVPIVGIAIGFLCWHGFGYLLVCPWAMQRSYLTEDTLRIFLVRTMPCCYVQDPWSLILCISSLFFISLPSECLFDSLGRFVLKWEWKPLSQWVWNLGILATCFVGLSMLLNDRIWVFLRPSWDDRTRLTVFSFNAQSQLLLVNLEPFTFQARTLPLIWFDYSQPSYCW